MCFLLKDTVTLQTRENSHVVHELPGMSHNVMKHLGHCKIMKGKVEKKHDFNKTARRFFFPLKCLGL